MINSRRPEEIRNKRRKRSLEVGLRRLLEVLVSKKVAVAGLGDGAESVTKRVDGVMLEVRRPARITLTVLRLMTRHCNVVPRRRNRQRNDEGLAPAMAVRGYPMQSRAIIMAGAGLVAVLGYLVQPWPVPA